MASSSCLRSCPAVNTQAHHEQERSEGDGKEHGRDHVAGRVAIGPLPAATELRAYDRLTPDPDPEQLASVRIGFLGPARYGGGVPVELSPCVDGAVFGGIGDGGKIGAVRWGTHPVDLGSEISGAGGQIRFAYACRGVPIASSCGPVVAGEQHSEQDSHREPGPDPAGRVGAQHASPAGRMQADSEWRGGTSKVRVRRYGRELNVILRRVRPGRCLLHTVRHAVRVPEFRVEPAGPGFEPDQDGESESQGKPGSGGRQVRSEPGRSPAQRDAAERQGDAAWRGVQRSVRRARRGSQRCAPARLRLRCTAHAEKRRIMPTPPATSALPRSRANAVSGTDRVTSERPSVVTDMATPRHIVTTAGLPSTV